MKKRRILCVTDGNPNLNDIDPLMLTDSLEADVKGSQNIKDGIIIQSSLDLNESESVNSIQNQSSRDETYGESSHDGGSMFSPKSLRSEYESSYHDSVFSTKSSRSYMGSVQNQSSRDSADDDESSYDERDVISPKSSSSFSSRDDYSASFATSTDCSSLGH